MERTLIKFECIWRKISHKGRCGEIPRVHFIFPLIKSTPVNNIILTYSLVRYNANDMQNTIVIFPFIPYNYMIQRGELSLTDTLSAIIHERSLYMGYISHGIILTQLAQNQSIQIQFNILSLSIKITNCSAKIPYCPGHAMGKRGCI